MTELVAEFYGTRIARIAGNWRTFDVSIEPVTIAGVAGMLRDVQEYPLGNKPIGGKTSLAGVQDKIVLAHRVRMEPGDRRLAINPHPYAGVSGRPYRDLRRRIRRSDRTRCWAQFFQHLD
ncbi:hypothetical protein [Psychromicrobium xiongbiense]|uniref:hypothetical protein n=1 Tax=Psychromicrobium xiongbiense TaxID=3051184 RepID=UPI002553E1F0|nr:hypothetical protein [Psychromicrobium sp. YIM S02556]